MNILQDQTCTILLKSYSHILEMKTTKIMQVVISNVQTLGNIKY